MITTFKQRRGWTMFLCHNVIPLAFYDLYATAEVWILRYPWTLK